MNSLTAPPPKPKSRLAENTRFPAIDAALGAVVFIWGINFVVMKIAFDELAPLLFNALRLTLAALLLLVVLWIREGWQPMPRRDWLKLAGLGLLGNTFYQVPFILGLELTTAGNSSLLIATIPVWAALLARLLGWERISWRIWMGIGLSFAGVLLVTSASSPEEVATGRPHFWGDVLTLLAAICWAAYTVFSKDVLIRYSPLRVSALTLAVGIVGLWIIALPSVLSTHWVEPAGWVWGAILYSGGLSIALSYVIWAAGVKHIGAARTAIYNNLVPVVTFIAAYVALRQPLGALEILGGAVVLTGIWITVRAK
jgi:drug/metabolite transporter (DMT)-like permease